MVLGYPHGISKKEIPYEAQIVRVADEYDAIVTKRQYTTHVNISETLKDLIKDTKPDPKFVALDQLSEKEKTGKINGTILKKVFKVVIDDTLYEITCTLEYVNYLKEQIKRLHKIEKFDEKMQNAKKQSEVDYYKEYMRLLFEHGEDYENYHQVLKEYEFAISQREELIEKLKKEIEIIKTLKA